MASPITAARPGTSLAAARPVALLQATRRVHPPFVAARTRQLPRAQQEDVGSELDNSDSEVARKRAEADRLRQEERFLVIGTGEATCKGCGYQYKPKNGDDAYPVAPGTKFQDLPEDWTCPTCGSSRSSFVSLQKEVAGFAANQGYGLGTNAMTGEQKSLLIFGSLAFFAFLLLLGYTLD